MKNTKLFGIGLATLLSLGFITGCGGGNSGESQYDPSGRLILNLKNVYFDEWQGGDPYTEFLENKFEVKFQVSNYDYENWDEMVYTAINGNNLTDVIQYNLKAYNFGSTYERWIENDMIKALPEDLSPWPNVESLINKASNVDALKVDGKIYGIPVLNDISNSEKDFSNMTYVYRRDIAKEIDKLNPSDEPVYREGDVYTWTEFDNLVKALSAHAAKQEINTVAMVDQEWGFPSVTNFYKNAPHCFDKDSNGKAINAFTSDGYVAGLEVAKNYVNDSYYSQDQFNFGADTANGEYLGGKAYILYDNFSLSNYIGLRQKFAANNEDVDLDDGTALLKVKGPDGKFALEGTENWFSMTMFNYDIEDAKMEKILDIIDYLLSEEGTRLAIYGLEGYDYTIVNGKIQLTNKGWPRDPDTDEFIPGKINGAKYLRYMATLGNDTKSFDPLTDKASYDILNEWISEMEAAKEQGKLRIVKEPSDISWMSTPTKNDKTETLLADANVDALKYAFDEIKDINDYKNKLNSATNWIKVLAEINEKLGK